MKKADFLRRYNNPEDDKKDIEGLVQAYELAVDYGMETDSLFKYEEGEINETDNGRYKARIYGTVRIRG